MHSLDQGGREVAKYTPHLSSQASNSTSVLRRESCVQCALSNRGLSFHARSHDGRQPCCWSTAKSSSHFTWGARCVLKQTPNIMRGEGDSQTYLLDCAVPCVVCTVRALKQGASHHTGWLSEENILHQAAFLGGCLTINTCLEVSASLHFMQIFDHLSALETGGTPGML